MVRNDSAKKAIHKVREFLELNAIRRKRSLSAQEVGQWLQLKQDIEQLLFSHPPALQDQRKSIRIRNLKFPAEFENGMEKKEAMVTEVSEGGLFIATQDPLPVGTQLPLSLNIPNVFVDALGWDGQQINLEAQVVFTNVGHSFGEKAFSGMGLKLVEDLNSETQKRWFAFIDLLLEEASQN